MMGLPSLGSECLRTIYNHRDDFFSKEGKFLFDKDVPLILCHEIYNFIKCQDGRYYFESGPFENCFVA